MTDPPRLCDDGDPFERALLGSARRDHGSVAAQVRCLVAASATTALVAHAGGAAASSTTAATATATGLANSATAASLGTATAGLATAAMSSSSVGAAGVGVVVAAKAIVIGFALGISVQGAVIATQHFRMARPSSEVADHADAVDAPAKVRSMAIGQLPVAPKAGVEQPKRLAPAPRSDTPNRIVVSPSVVENAPLQPATPGGDTANVEVNDALDREVALIDEARRFSIAGGHERAILLLDRHQREFPTASLGPESQVIRVQSLVGLGRRAEAERLALPFISGNPSSPITKRMIAILRHTETSP